MTETIAAIATSLNNAGISIIRISGEEALTIGDAIFRMKKGKCKLRDKGSHTIHYGYIVDHEEILDEVLVSVMKKPNTYTKEDVVEINCHGGVVVTKRILELIVRNGARMAEPGEFTKRAFLNGRIDLSQAEAVIDVIYSKSDLALKSSISQLRGNLLQKVEDIRNTIIQDVAYIEAALDDPEHIELDGFSEALMGNIRVIQDALRELVKTFENGKILREGIQTVILGKPNAGKSSLLNALLGEERAIVTDFPGTTRDTLEENINLGELVLTLCDTAGIRNTDDYIESIGVERAKAAAKNADLILYVVDGSIPQDENDRQILSIIKNKKALVLVNKSDLKQEHDKGFYEEFACEDIILLSAKYREGIEALKNRIKDLFFKGTVSWNDQIYITNIRHKVAIEEALRSLSEVVESINAGMPEDFYSIDLMNAYRVLGEIIGEEVNEDLIDTIFSRFCMGK